MSLFIDGVLFGEPLFYFRFFMLDLTDGNTNKNKKIIKWAVILAIVVVLNLFFNYTISLLYKTPDYNAFCAPEVYNKQYYEKNSCNADGGMWTENTAPRDLKGKTPAVPVTLEVSGWCNPTYTCRKILTPRTAFTIAMSSSCSFRSACLRSLSGLLSRLSLSSHSGSLSAESSRS